MIANAAAAIDNHKQEINDLNVFPVPDGDTGTNMSLTIGAAEKTLEAMAPDTLGHTAEAASSALLRGARGNSGVILSLLFRGFGRRLKDADTADSAAFADALAAGVESAYKAVMKPAEGTILTVSRLAAAAAVSASDTESDIEIILEKALAAGYEALADTINQNPVLKKAGVIDAGAKGYMYMLDGMLRALRGEAIVKAFAEKQPADKADFTQFTAEDITFTYCTEFIVDRKSNNNPDHLRDFLNDRGDSLVVVDDDAIIKVHVHTNEPGAVLTEALTYGPLLTIKIENMREQHSEASAYEKPGAPAPAPAAPKPQAPVEPKDFAIVAVCAGAGLEEAFNDLGADKIITGGQKMNPSTEDILAKIVEAPSDVVFVLPNNKNIIMAAEQCAPLTEKRVIVVPTRSIPQGVSAMLSIDGADGVEDMASCMTAAAKRVRTIQITTAARDSVFDGLEINKGEHIALLDDSLAANGADIEEVFGVVAEALGGFSPEFITIFTGEGAEEAETTALADRIGAAAPCSEITTISGGQPIYRYIISVE